jgi:hypothetical protein
MLAALALSTAGFTPTSRPRLARRELLSGATSCLVLSRFPSPAAARVEGIPLYAPFGSAPLPAQGFEVLYPALEQLLAYMTALRGYASGGEWSKVADADGVSEPAVIAQGKLVGSLASILGDDAYTVLSLKNRYLASARKLREALATSPPPPETSSSLDDMVSVLGLIKDLVPEKVVTQARRAPCRKSAGRRTSRVCLHPHAAPVICQVRAYEAAVREVAAEKAQAQAATPAASAPAPEAS